MSPPAGITISVPKARSNPANKALPVEDSALPRPARRFPFRAANAQEQREIDVETSTLLTSIDDMLHAIARRYLPRESRSDIEDAVQLCRVKIWQRVLPRFDAHHKPPTKVTSYAYRCAVFFFLAYRRKNHRQRNMSFVRRDLDALIARDSRSDAAIEAFAEKFLRNPARYLPRNQVRALQAMHAQPGEEMGVISRQLGYARPSSYSMIRRRAMDRVLEAAEDLAIAA